MEERTTPSASSSPTPSAQPEPEKAPDKKGTWFLLVLGLAIVGLSFYTYNKFDHWEQTGGTIRENAILLLIYDMFGKIGAAIFLGLIGLFLTWLGIKAMLGKKKEA
jgi:predicted phage tail protein